MDTKDTDAQKHQLILIGFLIKYSLKFLFYEIVVLLLYHTKDNRVNLLLKKINTELHHQSMVKSAKKKATFSITNKPCMTSNDRLLL